MADACIVLARERCETLVGGSVGLSVLGFRAQTAVNTGVGFRRRLGDRRTRFADPSSARRNIDASSRAVRSSREVT